MKIYLSVGEEVPQGYKTELGQAENAECTEILAPKIMDYISAQYMHQFITDCVTKLRHGGKLVVGGTELSNVSKAVFLRRLNTKEANEILYGTGQVKSGMVSIDDIISLFRISGLKITKKKIDDYTFVVEGIRE